MESKHTTTTWHLDDSVRPVRVVADGLIICEIPPHAAGLDIDIGRKIAAAPGLLEALKLARAYLSKCPPHGEDITGTEWGRVMDLSGAAINKATGGRP